MTYWVVKLRIHLKMRIRTCILDFFTFIYRYVFGHTFNICGNNYSGVWPLFGLQVVDHLLICLPPRLYVTATTRPPGVGCVGPDDYKPNWVPWKWEKSCKSHVWKSWFIKCLNPSSRSQFLDEWSLVPSWPSLWILLNTRTKFIFISQRTQNLECLPCQDIHTTWSKGDNDIV